MPIKRELQADALAFESLAKRRLADEYDAAQKRGEVATAGGDKSKLPNESFATVADMGLTHKDVHEAPAVRDAEAAYPGAARRALDRFAKQPGRDLGASVRWDAPSCNRGYCWPDEPAASAARAAGVTVGTVIGAAAAGS